MSRSHPLSLQRLWLPLLLACAASGAQAAICRVAPTASGAQDGSTWQDAMTLPAALAASGCDEIWLQQGLYKPGTQRADSFNIPRPLHLYGGFAGNETERGQRAANSRLTVLSGDIDGNDTATDGIVLDTSGIAGDNSYHVLRINQAAAALVFTPANTVIDGLTITGGQADGSGWENKGAGLLCVAVNANRECSPRIANVTFSGNLAANEGGGMLAYAKSNGRSSPEITHSTFSGNAAWYGGGLAVDITIQSDATTGSPSIAHSTFSGNVATGASGMGGAVYLNGTTAASVAHVTFANNTSSTYGGALHAHDGTQATITASIFWGNTASNGNQISLKGADTSLGDLTGSLVEGSSSGMYAYAGATLPSGSPFVTNPALGPLQDNGGPTWTMRPPVGSAAANKANCTTGQTDQRGAARPTVAGACDLGAVEQMDTIPFLPVAFTASTDQVRQIALSWAASSESVYYRVTRVVGGATVCQTASTACLLTGLPDGDSVDFNLTGYSDLGNSHLATASGQTLALPGQPANFAATSGDVRASTLTWDAPATGGPVERYIVTSVGTEVCNTTAQTCTVTPLADGAAYTFTLLARNAAGDSGTVNTNATTLALPATPASFTATPGASAITLDWTAAAGAVSYVVTDTTGGGSAEVCNTTALTCTVTGLAHDTAYTFALAARNAAGDGSPATAAASTFGVPGAPTGVIAAAGNARAAVGWAAPASDGGSPITGYRVEVSNDNTRTCTGNASATRCTVAGLANGTAYTFVVFAINAVGNSAPSGPSNSVTPRAPVIPTLPTPPEPEPEPEPISCHLTVPAGSSATLTCKGSATLGTGATLTVLPAAAGSPITPPASGSSATVILGGSPVTLAGPGQALVLASPTGSAGLVLGLPPGNTITLGAAPGQALLNLGPNGTDGTASGSQAVAGQGGATIQASRDSAGVLTVQVHSGSITAPCGLPCQGVPHPEPAATMEIHTGEQARTGAQGLVQQVTVAVPTQAPPSTTALTLPTTPQLGSTPERTPGQTLLQQVQAALQTALGTPLTAQGQQTAGHALWTLPGASTLGLQPLGLPQVDLTVPDGASFTPGGSIRIARQGVVQTFGPAPAGADVALQALRAFAPGVQVRVTDSGAWRIEGLGEAPLVVRPGWLGIDGPAAIPTRIEADDGGQLWLVRASGLRVPVFAAIAEPQTLQAILPAADPQGSLQVQVDGTAQLVLGGQGYVLLPWMQLEQVPAGEQQALWLAQEDGRVLLRVRLSDGWVQVLEVRVVPE